MSQINPPTIFLAIETSCDETGLAVLSSDGQKIKVLSQAIASQVDIHKETGGVIPEVAAREHVTVFQPLLKKVLREANVELKDIDAIAVTHGPGLQPALAVGVNAARTLSYGLNKPLIPVNHLEGHVYSALLDHSEDLIQWTTPEQIFPALALLVSGGHTLLVLIKDHLQYEILGSTLDDAVGEAFDKVARLLNLPYPGGPHLSKLAEQGKADAFKFPRPMTHSGDLNFSFSGLKTAVLYTWRDSEQTEEVKKDIAASFQQAVIETLISKVQAAIKQTNPKAVLLAGGVAANKRLREALDKTTAEKSIPLRCAPLSLCGDNATMIGLVGAFAHQQKRYVNWQDIEPVARLSL